jgi:hypothetical protein
MIEYLTASEAARRLHVSVNSIGRAAREKQIGIFAGGRLVALAPTDLDKLRPALHATPGNPNWIASRGKRVRRKASK